MRKMSHKRIATIILTAILVFTQNSTITFAEESVTEQIPVQNQEDSENASGSEESQESVPEIENTEEPISDNSENASTDDVHDNTSEESSDTPEEAEDTNSVQTDEINDFNAFADSFNENSDEDVTNIESSILESKSLNSANSSQADWYKNYKYEIDEANSTIILNKYLGGGDVYVYNEAYIDGKRYATCINGTAFTRNINITSVIFQDGCVAIGEKLSFTNCSNVESIDLEGLDTKNIHNMESAFAVCQNLKSLNLKGINTSGVSNMQDMFEHCSQLENIDLSYLDTSSVLRMDGMFWGCSILKELDLSSFDTADVNDFDCMFPPKLRYLNISSFTISSHPGMTNFRCVPMLYLKDLEEFISPKYCQEDLELPGNFIKDDNYDGLSDDGITYTVIKEGAPSSRYIRTNQTSQSGNTTTGFDLTKDGQCIINDGKAFSYNTKRNIFNEEVYEIASYDRYKEVFGNSINPDIYSQKYRNEEWVGNCYGMTSSAALMYKNRIEKSAYIKSGTSTLTSGGYDTLESDVNGAYLRLYNNSELTKIIERYQIWQDSDEFYSLFKKELGAFESKSQAQAFSEVISNIKTKKEPYMLSVYWTDYNTKNQLGHALLVDSNRAPEDIGNGWTRVYLYDPNYPYFENFGDNTPDASYSKAMERNIDLNTENGQWKFQGNYTTGSCWNQLGTDDQGRSINDSWLYFHTVDSLPIIFDGTAHLKGYNGEVCVSYACSDIEVYDENDNIIFKHLNNTVSELDETIVKRIPKIDNTIDNTFGLSQGQIILPNNQNYKLCISRGYGTVLQDGDYIGAATSDGVTIRTIDSTTASISTPYGTDVNVVMMDKQGESKFTSFSADVNINGSDNIFSLKGTTLDTDLKNAQNINMHVTTEKGEKNITGISTDSLKNCDISSVSPAASDNNVDANEALNPNNSDNTNNKSTSASDNSVQNGVDTKNVVISQSKKKVSHSKLKKKAQKVKITVDNTTGTVAAKNVSSKKLKKYLKVSVSGQTVTCKLKKGAPKGTYKVKVTVSGDANGNDITKTIKIKVK